tara:strand:+ start:6059 stop:6574 length:516 start_codon:yes stop_codon:yes gene_type:complete
VKKYKIIILPPDTHQFTIKDRLCDENLFFNQIINFYFKNEIFKENILIKYRTNAQKNKFPNELIENVNEGKLLDFCNEDSIVIGPVNSATIECLNAKIDYFCYRYDPGFDKNLSHTYTLDKILYVANNINQIVENFNQQKIFKDNFSINDLIYKDGLRLNEIVNKILQRIN